MVAEPLLDDDFDLTPKSSDLRNSKGRIRLSLVRDAYFSDFLDLGSLLDIFQEWQDDPEYVLLRITDETNDEEFYKAVKCAKRGNEVYRYRIRKRLKWMEDYPEDVTFFNDRVPEKRTRVLFVTLTVDTKSISRDEAWIKIGEEFNRWMSKMRRKFGKIRQARSWESTKRGYPQIHTVLIFEDRDFEVTEKKGKAWRIQYELKKEMDDLWPLGFIDVEAVQSLKGVLFYLMKYIMKAHANAPVSGKTKPKIDRDGALVTRATCWLFKKQSFSISIEWRESVQTLIQEFQDDDKSFDLMSQSIIQTRLDGEPAITIEFVGIYHASELGLKGDEWVADVPGPP